MHRDPDLRRLSRSRRRRRGRGRRARHHLPRLRRDRRRTTMCRGRLPRPARPRHAAHRRARRARRSQTPRLGVAGPPRRARRRGQDRPRRPTHPRPLRVARLFDVEIGNRRFLYHYNEAAFGYEQALAGHYLLTTSLTPAEASTVQVVSAYRQLQQIERRFRALKDFLHLRPVRHWTENASAVTSLSASTPRSSKRSSPPTCAPPTSAIPTSATCTSPVPEPHVSSTGSGPSPSTPTGGPSTSSPVAPRTTPASCTPSASKPPGGTGPTSPDPAGTSPVRCSGNTFRRALPTRTNANNPPKSGPSFGGWVSPVRPPNRTCGFHRIRTDAPTGLVDLETPAILEVQISSGAGIRASQVDPLGVDPRRPRGLGDRPPAPQKPLRSFASRR